MTYSVWIEGEYAGEFDDLEQALAEAAICAYARHATAIVADESSQTDHLVDVEAALSAFSRLAPLPSL